MIKQVKPRVLKRDTRAIIATGRRVVLRSPWRVSTLYGEGKYPLGPRVACGTKDDVELDIALIQAVKGVEFVVAPMFIYAGSENVKFGTRNRASASLL